VVATTEMGRVVQCLPLPYLHRCRAPASVLDASGLSSASCRRKPAIPGGAMRLGVEKREIERDADGPVALRA
jgi:hypothetical protein